MEGYSRGMRQRLHIARGLLHVPEVLFLDEPSIGVDPVAARELRRTVADLAAAGTTVLLTTHYMAEADELCDRIAVIADGGIQALGTPAELKPPGGGPPGGRGARPTACRTAVGRAARAARRTRDRGRGPGRAASADRAVGRRPATCRARCCASSAGIRLGRVDSREPTLEDAYMAIVERRMTAMRTLIVVSAPCCTPSSSAARPWRSPSACSSRRAGHPGGLPVPGRRSSRTG